MEINIFIVTGTSGAGKSQALKCFEDIGFHCIDNIPVKLLPHLAELIKKESYLKKVALGIDIREAKYSENIDEYLTCFNHHNLKYRIIFIDCDDKVLYQRFSETRHKHPLGENLYLAIKKERKILSPLKEKADKVIDTTRMTLGELKEVISSLLNLRDVKEFKINVISFGYKYGVPLDADIIMDVRFLPNPFYVKSLKNKTGLDPDVRNYLKKQRKYMKFVKEWYNYLKKLIPLYIKEGKSYLTIAFGCTGGKHRSVSVAWEIANTLKKEGYNSTQYHRDVNKQ
jgi:UPF0042 nucleotide-binding protein